MAVVIHLPDDIAWQLQEKWSDGVSPAARWQASCSKATGRGFWANPKDATGYTSHAGRDYG